jgi:hypothetical protein
LLQASNPPFASNRKAYDMKPLVIIIAVAALAIGAWYVYEDSQKSDLEKAAEDVSDTVDDIADDIDQ